MGDPAGRPRLHLSTPSGWLNDPHGITWHGGRYHAFFQYNPDAPHWTAGCRWGHATSPDLVAWDAGVDVALAPGGPVAGCWTGSLVLDGAVPTILHTAFPHGGDPWVQVATADPAMTTWTPHGPVRLDPPAGVTEFRDPFVLPDSGGWSMVVGGRAGPDAVAVRYRSIDLRTWTPDGELCRHRSDAALPTGDAWECVQFLPLDGAWVLIASAWTGRPDDGVVYAVGDLDGSTFRPRSWRRFDHGGALYATSAFRDADGAWCALSWCRETEPPHPHRTRAGALSLPHRLAVAGDRLVITPHPAVDALRGPAVLGPLPRQVELLVTGAGAVLTHDGAEALVVARDGDAVRLTVGGAERTLPGAGPVRVLLDEDIAEVFAGGELAVVRTAPPVGEVRVTGAQVFALG